MNGYQSERPLEPPALPAPMVPGLFLQLPQLAEILGKLDAVIDGTGQRWYTLEQAHTRKYGALHGGVSLATIRNTLAMQPRGGIPDGWQSGRKVWRADTIEEWCLVDDAHLGEYLLKHNPRVSVPKRILEANERHVQEYPSIVQEA
ncbi:MAG: hypothetical protein WAX33_04315 [Rectinemataceae bacterium]